MSTSNSIVRFKKPNSVKIEDRSEESQVHILHVSHAPILMCILMHISNDCCFFIKFSRLQVQSEKCLTDSRLLSRSLDFYSPLCALTDDLSERVQKSFPCVINQSINQSISQSVSQLVTSGTCFQVTVLET